MMKCPVCGNYEFERENNFEICAVCGWENDGIQMDDQDEEDCANEMSLNQARMAWAKGQKVR